MADPRRSNAWLIIVIILCCCGAVGIFIAALTRSTSVDLEVPTVLVILGALFSFYRYRHWRDNEEEFKCFIQHDAPHSRQNKEQMNALKPIVDLRMRETLDEVCKGVPNAKQCYTKRRRLVRRFGFKATSVRKQLKAMRRRQMREVKV